MSGSSGEQCSALDHECVGTVGEASPQERDAEGRMQAHVNWRKDGDEQCHPMAPPKKRNRDQGHNGIEK
jgi:hypothetical protein